MLAGLLELGGELAAAVDLEGPQRKRHPLFERIEKLGSPPGRAARPICLCPSAGTRAAAGVLAELRVPFILNEYSVVNRGNPPSAANSLVSRKLVDLHFTVFPFSTTKNVAPVRRHPLFSFCGVEQSGSSLGS